MAERDGDSELDKLIDKLLTRLIVKALAESRAHYMVRVADMALIEGMADYFDKHTTIPDNVRIRAVKTLRNIRNRAELIDDDDIELLGRAIEMWNKHVADEKATDKHYLGKAYPRAGMDE